MPNLPNLTAANSPAYYQERSFSHPPRPTHFQQAHTTQEKQRHPICIVIPSSANDVATAVKSLAELSNSTFAIRSGGHSSAAGAANTDNGVTINVQQLKTIQLTRNDTVISVGGGASCSDLFAALKGGQNSFGVVTRFDMAIFAQD
ncbi:hypothetical protein BO94DRAFT_581934 [Aspergillus sclerotioniger CBS 115572]|uniref:FAD-binding PCMH-type domain-containing protein n=1 Tax=Aspergillus sclerotioniger CBS 115572 TaxID=1450535 RepID=A0A317X8L9_9EURO|nr:hypothetical protein BO94DRAFT_581934 [Aspergillus sclerotioniger CBS 115572]PWY94541.1 hypothetical protein BO94DRAFT_581934 [Aspergillus sclerotioniger CBS 115572]